MHKEQTTILGIDPGAHGALAALYSCAEAAAYAFDADDSLVEILTNEVALARMDGIHLFAFVEKVHAFPGQGVSSSFKFGQSYGTILGALEALKIPYKLVPPMVTMATREATPAASSIS